MRVQNNFFKLDGNYNATAGYVYLAVTTAKELYLLKQVGDRSWDAMSMDFNNATPSIHSNRKDIIADVWAELDVDFIVEIADKTALRKAIMAHQFGGNMFAPFEIERGE